MAGNDSYTKLLLHMDDVALSDDSGSNHSTTKIGGAARSDAQVKFGGYSMYVDGSGDRLQIPNDSDFDFGTGDFTIDLWIRAASLGTYRDIVGRRNLSANNTPFLIQHGHSSERIHFGYADTNGSWVFSNKHIGDITVNTWHHIAVVRSGSNWYTFLDGVAGDTWTDGSTSLWLNSEDLYVGGTSTAQFHGYIDELRISKGIARWTENFTPPTEAYSQSYIVGGTLSDDARVLVISESGWTILDNDTYSAGSYQADLGSSDPGQVLVLARKSDGEVLVYGNVDTTLA